MFKRLLFYFIITISLFTWQTARSQVTTEGNDFWLGFMENGRYQGVQRFTLDVFISAKKFTTGRILYNGGSVSFTLNAANNFTFSRTFNTNDFHIRGSNRDPSTTAFRNKWIRITSTGNNGNSENFAVYAVNNKDNSADATVVLPVASLGNEYYVMSYADANDNAEGSNIKRSQFMVMAVEDSTRIVVVSPVNLNNGRDANKRDTITFNKAGDLVQLQPRAYRDDLTGTYITVIPYGSNSSCKNVAVFAGHSFGRVGSCVNVNNATRDHLFEQMYPTNTWGKNYIFVPYLLRNNGDDFRIMAKENNTRVVVNTNDTITLSRAGDFRTYTNRTAAFQISANKPISVAQYTRTQEKTGTGNSCSSAETRGDPFYIMLSPNEQLLRNITFNAFTGQVSGFQYYMNVITKTADTSRIKFDGSKNNLVGFIKVPNNGDFSYARRSISSGTHRLESDSGFIAYVYGFSNTGCGNACFESFGYSTGASLNNLNASFTFVDTADASQTVIQSPSDAYCLDKVYRVSISADTVFKNFTWNFGDGSPEKSGQNVVHKFTKIGTYQMRVTMSTASGDCGVGSRETVTKVLKIFKPYAFVKGPKQTCEGDTYIYYADSIDLTNRETNKFVWKVYGGEIVGADDGDSIRVKWNSANTNARVTLFPNNAVACSGDSSSLKVIVNPYIKVTTPSGPTELCDRDMKGKKYNIPQKTGYLYQWGIEGGTILTTKDTSHIEVDWNGSGTHKLWVDGGSSVDSLCYLTSDTLLINIQKAYDTLEIAAAKDKFCYGESIRFNAIKNTGYVSYSWDFGDGSPVATGDTVFKAYTNAGTYTVKLTASTASDVCEIKNVVRTYKVEVSRPTKPVISGRRNVCDNATGIKYKLTDTEKNTYTWSVTGGTISQNQGDSITVAWGAGPVGVVKLKTKNSLGCEDSVSYNVTINDFKATAKPSGPDSVCTFDKVGKKYSVPQTFGYGYNWQISNGSIKSGQGTREVTVDWGNAGQGYIWLASSNVVDSLCFAASDSLKVIIKNAYDTLEIAAAKDKFCYGESIRFNAIKNTGYVSYSWDFGDGSPVATGDTVFKSYANAGTYTVKLTASTVPDICQMKNLVRTYKVEVSRPTKPVISGRRNVCDNATGIKYKLTDTEKNTYTWSVTGGTISQNQGDSITVAWGAGPVGVVKLKTKNSLGCEDSVSYNVTINDFKATAKPSGPDSVCTFDKVGKKYSVPQTFGYGYNWQISNGSIKSGQGTREVTVDWGNAGQGYIWLASSNVVDSLCFAASDSLKVVIKQEPNKVISITNASDTLCANQSLSFGLNADAQYEFFEWNMGDGAKYFTKNINHTYTTTGSKTITVKARTAPTVCYTEAFDTLTIFIVEPTATIVGPNSVCPDGPAIKYWLKDKYFTNSYQWSVSGGTISGSSTSDTVRVAWGATNPNASLKLIPKESGRACVGDEVVLPVRVNRVLDPKAAIGPDSVCNDEKDVPFTLDVVNNTSIYTWYLSGGTVKSGQGTANPKFDFPTTEGFYKIWYLERSTVDTLCEGWSDTAKVFVRKRPSRDFEIGVNRDTACLNESLNFRKVSADAEMKTFEWDFGDGSAKKYGANVSHAYSKEGTYKVKTRAYTAPHVCYTETFDSMTIYVVKPAMTIAGRNEVCKDQEVEYTYGTTFFADTYDWAVTGGTIASGQGTAKVRIKWGNANPNAQVRCTPKSKFGCDGDLVSFTVRVNEYQPTETPSGPDSICVEDRLNRRYTVPAKTGYAYNWNLVGGTIRSGQGTRTVFVDWDTVTTFTTRRIWLESSNVIDNLCFDRSADFPVFIEPAPSKVITVSPSDTSFCTNRTATFNLTSHPLINLLDVDFGDGTKLNAIPRTNRITHTYTRPGVFTVKVTGKTGRLCKTVANGEIKISIEEPRAKVSGKNEVCQGTQGVEYTSTDTTRSRGNYRWTVTGGTITGSNIGNTVIVNWSNTATQGIVRCTPFNLKNCSGPVDSMVVKLNPYQPTPLPTGPTEFCVDDKDNKRYTIPASAGRDYNWEITGGQIVAGQGTRSVTVNWNGVGTGQIWVRRSTLDKICFEASPKLNVKINPGLDSLLEMVRVTALPGDSTRLQLDWRIEGVTEPNLPLEIFRKTNNGAQQRIASVNKNQTSYTDQRLDIKRSTYQYFLQSKNRCNDQIQTDEHGSILLRVTRNEKDVSATLQWNEYKNWKGGVAQYRILRKLDDEPDFTQYAVTNDTKLEYPDGIDAFRHCFVVIAEEQGTGVESRSNEACTEFRHKVFVYDMITPNGDGFNDVFVLDRIERYTDNTLIILNRFGQEVYRVSDYKNDWRGTNREGDPLEGTYFYIFIYKDKQGREQVEKGPITIQR